MLKNTGRKHEQFVAKLQKALMDSQGLIQQHNISIELNKKLIDKNGIEREFDIYWEYEFGGIAYRTVIECKDYESKISIDRIDSFIGKLRDFPGIQGVFATKTGYQSGAEKKAKANNIQTLVVRNMDDCDWIDKDGNPYIQKIHMDMNIIHPPRIIKFEPKIDREWVIKEGLEHQIIRFSEPNDKIL